MTDSLSTLTDRVLLAAKKAGADSADALALAGRSVSIEVRNGDLEHAERAEGTDIGLRVFIGQRSAITSASDTSDATLTQLAERAVAMAREAPEDPYAGLADPEQFSARRDGTGLELCDGAAEPDAETLRDMANRCEAAALSVEGVTQSIGASAGYSHTQIHLATSAGFTGGYTRTGHSLSCGAVSGSGTDMERDHDGDSRVFGADLRSAHDIGHSAGTRAVALHGARQAGTGAFPVLFDERISSSLIGHMMSALNGAAIVRGSSWLRDRVGQDLLPKGLSLVEDSLRPRVSGTRPFDGEGLPTAQRDIIRDGVLMGYTLDLASARKLGLTPTGSAARGVSGPPRPTHGPLHLTPGQHSRAELMAQMGTGLLVTSLIGSTINPNTGDYSRGASGFWIEGGEIAYPVNQITIAGNLIDMLARMIPANDARSYLSTVVPSLLIEGMTLAGS